MTDLINKLNEFFKNKTIIKLNNRPLTFSSAVNVSDKEQKQLGSIFNTIIIDSNKIINPQLVKNNKSTSNPNSKLTLSTDKTTNSFRELAEIIFKNLDPSSKTYTQLENQYWFLYAITYQTLISSTINIEKISDPSYYSPALIKSLYNQLSKDKDKFNQLIISQLLDELCQTKDEYDDSKLKDKLKEKCGRRLQINATTNVSNKCAAYIGTNILKPCRQEAICERIIACDSSEKVSTKQFEEIIKKLRESLVIYYAYLANECQFTLKKINKHIEKLQETESNIYLETLTIPSLQLPPQFVPIIEKQDRELNPEYYQSGGHINLSKCYKQLSKMSQKDLKYITRQIGKTKLLRYLDSHKHKKDIQKLINKIKKL